MKHSRSQTHTRPGYLRLVAAKFERVLTRREEKVDWYILMNRQFVLVLMIIMMTVLFDCFFYVNDGNGAVKC